MGQITHTTLPQGSKELARHYNSMTVATQVTAVAMQEIGGLQRYTGVTVVKTIQEAQQILNNAGPLSFAQESQVHYRTRAYLQDVLAIKDEAAHRIVTLLQQR
jgi:hypothetical protein